MSLIFDSHTHYDDQAFESDRTQLLEGLKTRGVGLVVNISSNFDSVGKSLALAEKYDFIYMAAGIHPTECYDLSEKDFDEVIRAAKTGKCVAIGEIGLDYHYEDTDRQVQKKWFEMQIALAKEMKLPIVVHSRDAAKDTLDIIKAEKASDTGGVIHCFSYEKEMAREYLDMGFYIGVGGVLTFKKSRKLKEVIEYMPMDKMLLETDCPYLAPEPFRGKRNDSSLLKYVAEAVSSIKGISPQDVIDITYDNACRMYKINMRSKINPSTAKGGPPPLSGEAITKQRRNLPPLLRGGAHEVGGGVLKIKMSEINPRDTIKLIKEKGFPVQKRLGQNFLVDPDIPAAIVSAAGVLKDDVVLEIGPGLGALTSSLLDVAAKVIAVETDKMLIPILEETFSGYDNFVLINADVLKTDLNTLLEAEASGRRIKIVANLPYNITTPILMKLLKFSQTDNAEAGADARQQFSNKKKSIDNKDTASDMPQLAKLDSVTVMVQKEVAERITAGPGSKDYGALSVAIRYFADTHIALHVSRKCFYPVPGVDSAVIRLDLYDDKPFQAKDEELMFKIVRAAFNQRRKTLVNALLHGAGLNFSREQILNALRKLGLEESIRGERLTPADFAIFSDVL